VESHQEVTVVIINLSLYRLENVMGLGKCIKVKEVSIHESFLRKQILLVNKRILNVREKFTDRSVEAK
jgi:hypothetical protein